MLQFLATLVAALALVVSAPAGAGLFCWCGPGLPWAGVPWSVRTLLITQGLHGVQAGSLAGRDKERGVHFPSSLAMPARAIRQSAEGNVLLFVASGRHYARSQR